MTTTAEPSRLVKYKGLTMQTLLKFYRYRLLLYAMVVQGLRERMAGSALGPIFLVIYPLVFLSIYSFVFISILKVRVPNMTPQDYTLSIFCGLVPFLAFSEALSVGAGSISGNASLVKNLVFPYEMLPVKDVLTTYVAMLPAFVILSVSVAFSSGVFWTQLLVPIVLVLQVILSIGLAFVFSTVSIFFRDIQKFMPILILFLMMVSPIGYTADMLSGQLGWILNINPLAIFIETYRDLLFGKLHLFRLVQITLTSGIVFALGHVVVKRLRPLVFDYV
jgi:lipopolysaccharide transport system permease protein